MCGVPGRLPGLRPAKPGGMLDVLSSMTERPRAGPSRACETPSLLCRGPHGRHMGFELMRHSAPGESIPPARSEDPGGAGPPGAGHAPRRLQVVGCRAARRGQPGGKGFSSRKRMEARANEGEGEARAAFSALVRSDGAKELSAAGRGTRR